MDAKTALESDTMVTLFYHHKSRQIFIEDGDQVTTDEAKLLFDRAIVGDCNMAMTRLCNCDFDMEKVEREYQEMDGGRMIKAKDEDEFIRKVVLTGTDAFWAAIAQCYRDDTDTGDFPPEADMAFVEACTIAVRTWVHYNITENGS